MKTKICRQCKEHKELSTFVKLYSDYRGICKKCYRENEKERRNQLSQKDKIKVQELNRKRYKEQNLYEKRMYNEHLKCKYGITIKDYDGLLKKQNGVCAICSLPEIQRRKGKLRRLCLDHSHSTGEIRGLLCSNCNIALGKLNDNIEILKKAITYLEKQQTTN